jgi:hypothetical protein
MVASPDIPDTRPASGQSLVPLPVPVLCAGRPLKNKVRRINKSQLELLAYAYIGKANIPKKEYGELPKTSGAQRLFQGVHRQPL